MRAGRCPSGGCSLPDADGGAGTIVLALAGNPNSGKTTLFNALTGARRHVGNYPGVTVELDEGRCAYGGARFRVVDLPGAYSLAAASPEEAVTRDFLLKQRPDVVAQVVDASNLERGLYLAVQLRELGVRLILVLNMADVAKARGIEFDLKRLSALLDAPVVPAVFLFFLLGKHGIVFGLGHNHGIAVLVKHCHRDFVQIHMVEKPAV